MAALPSRWIGNLVGNRIEVRKVDSYKAPYGEITTVSVDDLSNGETFKVAAALGLNPKNYKTILDRKLAIVRAIENGNSWNPKNARPLANPNNDWTPPPVEEIKSDDETEIPAPSVPENFDSSEFVKRPELVSVIEAVSSVAIDLHKLAETVEARTPIIRVIQVPDKPEIKFEAKTHFKFDQVLTAVSAGCHVMLVGPAGTGKSTIAEQVAEALGREFSTISVDPTMYRDMLFGFKNVHGEYVPGFLREPFENGNSIANIDEIDNGNASVISGLNQFLANSVVGFPDKQVRKGENFGVIASANTFGTGATSEYVGRSQLDAATLDRFVRIEIPIDLELESAITLAQWPENPVECERWIGTVRAVRANVETYGLKVIVSPRASLKGAALLRAGMDIESVSNAVLYAGMSDDVLRKVKV